MGTVRLRNQPVGLFKIVTGTEILETEKSFHTWGEIRLPKILV